MTQPPLDFLILLAGIPFLALAAACYMLGREGARVRWEWLCASGCMLCLHIWMEVAEMVSGGLRSGVAENLVLLLAYITLFGFAVSQEKLRWRYRALWYIVPASVGAAVVLPGGSLAETMITAVVGLPAAMMAGAAVWLWGRGDNRAVRRLSRVFAILLPCVPAVELLLGGSFTTQIKAGAHAAPTYVGYLVVGTLLGLTACAIDAILLKRDWGIAAVKSNLVNGLTLILFLAMTLIAGGFFTRHMAQLRYNEAKATAERRDVTVAESINSACRTGEKICRVLARDNALIEALRAPSHPTLAKAREAIWHLADTFEGPRMLLMDSTARIVATNPVDDGIVGRSESRRPYVRSALAGIPTIAIAAGQESSKRALVAAAPVSTPDEVLGLAVVETPLQPLEDNFPRDSITLLVSPEGLVWMSSQAEWLFQQLWGKKVDRSDNPAPAAATTRYSLTGHGRPLISGDEVWCESERYMVNVHAAGPPGWSVASLSSLRVVQRSRGIGLLMTGAASVILITLAMAIRQRTESLVAQNYRATLEQNMHQMERLIRVLSHDLRTPLAASKATVDLLLLDDRLDDETRDLMARVGDQQMRMADMVTRMLDAMRIRSGAMEWSWDKVDVCEVLQAARATVLALPERSPELEIELTIDESVNTISGDKQSIRRLVENLATNAVRHTPKGKVTISAEVIQRDRANWLCLKVRDTGEGMDAATLGLLGQPFVLGGMHKGSGSGLGVGICCGICAAHGGRLTVRSRPGAGATFTAWLKTDLPAPHRTTEEPAVQIVS